MIYIQKRTPSHSIIEEISQQKSSEEWKKLPEIPPKDKKEKSKYTSSLRTMFGKLNSDELRRLTLAEQHGLCAYCMRKIDNSHSSTKIEHWYPLSLSKSEALDYNNFLAVCAGKDQSNREVYSCCDESKASTIIKIDPRNPAMMRKIYYVSNGEIGFDLEGAFPKEVVEQITKELEIVLWLNKPSSGLIEGRKAVYESCKKIIEKAVKGKSRSAAISAVKRKVENLQNCEQYPAYAGVMLFYFVRWLKQHDVKMEMF